MATLPNSRSVPAQDRVARWNEACASEPTLKSRWTPFPCRHEAVEAVRASAQAPTGATAQRFALITMSSPASAPVPVYLGAQCNWACLLFCGGPAVGVTECTVHRCRVRSSTNGLLGQTNIISNGC